MTIYSLHANRGKCQILATYDSPKGVASSTVTSLSSPDLAAPIVDALNRISALATVPLSVFDHREGKVNRYPRRHLAALTDREARADLLVGEHSLWYEYVCLELHRALSDLDAATAAVPPPVLTAITVELETEARELRNALAEYSEGIAVPETDERRDWEFGHPFVAYDGGMEMLGTETREELDRVEDGISSDERARAVADLRVLVTAYAQCSSEQAALDSLPLSIFSEPYDSDGYYLSVHMPEPQKREAATWEIEIGHWEPDDPEDEDCSSATGSSDVRCELSAPPTADGLTRLLDDVEKQPTILTKWAGTEVGAMLDGTEFMVTHSYHD
ncbi:hypothetical protein SAMN05216251_102329 [Actinacidiphila alni]|uniref:Uncharacterized protein n=1 Tax=Actinacidiphila alni TaxID=380248 RepID=A0A1I1Z5G5_9ACTN|nr:hypothetical protein [Actinacidiphila alni]SFE27056.1 hypothetical protein SAMN05216251_102329 [Actinacidiphila alni]